MKFGVRECANIVFRAKTPTNIGKYSFSAGQPVLYIDTATTSSVEQSTNTVYAQGGRGNVRLVSWEGEKTLTFTVEDALLSPISLAMLSGADVFQGSETVQKVHFHTTTAGASLEVANNKGTIDLSDFLGANENLCETNDSPIYVIFTDGSGDLTGEMVISGNDTVTVKQNAAGAYQIIEIEYPKLKGLNWGTSAYDDGNGYVKNGTYSVFVDYYLDKASTAVDELQIAADNFAGNYYVEADTLFRRQSDGVDLPANLTFPNVKIQSNLTFQLSGTGDPSTFTFTMDALPGYTYFDKTRKVMCVIQVIEDFSNADKNLQPVMPSNAPQLEHKKDEVDDSHYLGYGDGVTTTGGNQDGEAVAYAIYGNNSIVAEGTATYALVSSTLPDAVTWSIDPAAAGSVSGNVTGVTVTAGAAAATATIKATVDDEVVATKTISITAG